MFTCACTLTGSLCLCFVKLATHTEPQASNFSSDNWYFECGWLNMGFSFSQYQCFTLSIRPSFLFGCISERVSYHMLAILPAKSHCYLTLASLMTVTGLFSMFRQYLRHQQSLFPESHRFSLFYQYSCPSPKFRKFVFSVFFPSYNGFSSVPKVTVFAAFLPTV